MTDEIDSILDKALTAAGQEFIDGELVESAASFEKFMVVLATFVFPDHEISISEPGTLIGKAAWSFTIDISEVFEQMKAFSPGHNRDVIVGVLERQLVRRNTFKELKGQDPAERFDPSKLILVPKMGSFIRNGAPGMRHLGGDDKKDVMIGRPAYGYVHSVAAINEPTHLMYVPGNALPIIGLSEDELFELAMENLRKSAEKVTVEFEDGFGLIGSDVMDGMPSQLIFYPDFWKSLSEKVGDHLFVHVVEHDQIIVCKASERETIFGIIGSVAAGKIEALLPATFFTYDDDGFRLFARTLPDDA